MTSIEFTEKISEVVYDSTVSGCVSIMQKPPGRSPSLQMQELSEWFNQLSEFDRDKVKAVIELTSRQSIFGMLAVIDGVRQVDCSDNKGILELRYLNDGHSQLLNDPKAESLHDIFNQLVPPQ